MSPIYNPEKKTVEELKDYCRRHKIPNYSSLLKDQLIKVVKKHLNSKKKKTASKRKAAPKRSPAIQESELTKENSKLIDGFLGLAQEYINNQEYEKAEQEIEKIIAIEPRNFSALIKLGLVNYKVGKLDEAVKVLEAGATLRPKEESRQIFFQIANYSFENGRYEEALSYCTKVITKNPNFQNAIDLKAQIKNKIEDILKEIINKKKDIEELELKCEYDKAIGLASTLLTRIEELLFKNKTFSKFKTELSKLKSDCERNNRIIDEIKELNKSYDSIEFKQLSSKIGLRLNEVRPLIEKLTSSNKIDAKIKLDTLEFTGDSKNFQKSMLSKADLILSKNLADEAIIESFIYDGKENKGNYVVNKSDSFKLEINVTAKYNEIRLKKLKSTISYRSLIVNNEKSEINDALVCDAIESDLKNRVVKKGEDINIKLELYSPEERKGLEISLFGVVKKEENYHPLETKSELKMIMPGSVKKEKLKNLGKITFKFLAPNIVKRFQK